MSPTPEMIRALRGETTERVPVWYMRQAGRYLPEYNRVREGKTFLELCANVDAAVEVSLQPLDRFDLDAVIMFSDILTPLSGVGVPLHFAEKQGPVIERTIQSEGDLGMLANYRPEQQNAYVGEILRTLRVELERRAATRASGRPALLGFAGAPFTLASYLVEGGTTRTFERLKRMLFGQPDLFARLADRLTEMTIAYLRMQIQAGADAVQLFDSWAGVLAPADYEEFAAPYVRRIREALRGDGTASVPFILFTGTGAHLLREMSALGPDVISLDWRVTREQADACIPATIALQGNLDPLVLYGSEGEVRRRTRLVLEGFAGRPGYVFNLGHGIHPQTPINNVHAMLQTVREFRS